MENNVCSSVACFLSTQGGLVSFPLVTIAGLVDGINPCAIGMMLLLLGYIIIFARKPEKILYLGGAYVLTIYLTYLTIGLLFYKSVGTINFSPYRDVFDRFLGSILLFVGVVNLKDFFWPGRGFSLEILPKFRHRLLGLVEKVSLPATIVLAVLVTLLEAPCSLPIYAGTATILNQSGLGLPIVLGYFLYYNFLFVLPLLVLLFLVWQGREMAGLKEWEHKAKKWMKLSLGVLLVLMSAWLFL